MIDIVILVVLAVFAFLGWKRGLIRSLAELLVMVLALLLSAQIAKAAAPAVVDNALRPAAHAAISQQADEIVAENLPDAAPAQMLERALDAIPNELIRERAKDLLGESGLASDWDPGVSARDALVRLGFQAVDTVLDTLVLDLLQSVLCLVCFVVLTILLRLAVKALSLTFQLPVLKQLNELGGMLLGLAKGLILVLLVVWVLRAAGVMTAEMAEGSVLAGVFTGVLGRLGK